MCPSSACDRRIGKGFPVTDTKSENRRYGRRMEQNGTWTVFDSLSGLPAEIGSRQATGMQPHDAEEMVDILNRMRPAEDSGTVH